MRLPRKENTRSHHQHLFEENVRKTKSGSMNFKNKRFGSCFYAGEGVATYPSAGGRRVTRGMRVPFEEYARSRHQRLFEENFGKTGIDAIYELFK